LSADRLCTSRIIMAGPSRQKCRPHKVGCIGQSLQSECGFELEHGCPETTLHVPGNMTIMAGPSRQKCQPHKVGCIGQSLQSECGFELEHDSPETTLHVRGNMTVLQLSNHLAGPTGTGCRGILKG
jgi:hypothetical protein